MSLLVVLKGQTNSVLTNYYTVTVKLPQVYFTSVNVATKGDAVIPQSINFQATRSDNTGYDIAVVITHT